MNKEFSKWDSHKVLRETIGKHVSRVAGTLNLSASMVSKWQRSPKKDYADTNTGYINPIDRLDCVIREMETQNPDGAYYPIYWFCNRFGFSIPKKKMRLINDQQKTFLEAVLDWNKGFGETAAEIQVSIMDGKITEEEQDKIYKKAMRQIESLEKIISFKGVVAGTGANNTLAS